MLTADQPVASYWLSVVTAEDCDTSAIKGAAILRYEGAPEDSETIAQTAFDIQPGPSSSVVSFRPDQAYHLVPYVRTSKMTTPRGCTHF